jgi:pantoate--beta-alanine ligase
MKLIISAQEMLAYSSHVRKEGKTIGFVPTMGSLHGGHMSLVSASVAECDITVLSVFVNPAQFGSGEDLEKYPRDLESDSLMSEKAGVDVMFVPSEEEMYPEGFSSYVEVGGSLAQGLCAKSRPGHFKGVTTVVAKLFNMVIPNKAYFGQKDAQQAAVVKRMVKDLNFPIAVRVMPIVREEDGLAMSSRNSYLSGEERRKALGISRSLEKAREMVLSGEVSSDSIKQEIKSVILSADGVKIDYVEIVDGDTLEPVDKIRDNSLIAVAVYVGATRLIDNTVIGK